ncbi:MAG: Holliday junction branch migration protein RuvA [Planctomycetota bacterium]
MIVRISGLLSEIDEESAIIDRDGIAYQVLVPSYAVHELAANRGRQITLHTLEYLEGSAAGGNLIPRLIGFLHPEDRAFFQQFVTVKGVGIRKGLRALAEPVARIAAHIESGDLIALRRLPGIGKRMTEQIVAELRGKVAAYAYAAEDVPEAAKHALSDSQRDAIEILVAWGDSRADAERWIARVAQLHDDLDSPEAWVRAAYRIKSGTEA